MEIGEMALLQFFNCVDGRNNRFGIGQRRSRGLTANRRTAVSDDGEKWIQDEIDKRGWRGSMDNPNFKFTPILRSWARQVAKKVRGVSFEDIYQDLYISLVLQGRGIWSFDPSLGQPLDGFWNHIAKNRAMTFERDRIGLLTRMPTAPIQPGKEEGDTSPGISEQVIRGNSPDPQEQFRTDELLNEFREWLSGERLGDTLVKIWDVMAAHAKSDPLNPLRQKDLADLTGMSSGQITHYYKMIMDSFKAYAEDEPELLQALSGREKLKAKPTPGPKTGIYSPDDGTPPVEIVLVRRGEKTVSVKRADGQPWENGALNKNVPKPQVQMH